MIDLKKSFFPKSFKIEQVHEKDGGYVFDLMSTSENSFCPQCNEKSSRTHSYQERRARDLPILGKTVTLQIKQKRYFWDNRECEVDIFTERNELINHYSQFTERCRNYMLKVAAHVSCESAVKILAYQGIKVSGDTLLNMIKASGDKYQGKVGKKIGVDDWAYRRGQEYGTIICDLETHEIIEVLEGRDGETFEKWLRGHPDIEIVSRDRASAYSSAVGKVLPEAIQIADRFHITKNLLDALKDTMKSFMPEITEVPIDETTEPIEIKSENTVKKTRKRWDAKNHK